MQKYPKMLFLTKKKQFHSCSWNYVRPLCLFFMSNFCGKQVFAYYNYSFIPPRLHLEGSYYWSKKIKWHFPAGTLRLIQERSFCGGNWWHGFMLTWQFSGHVYSTRVCREVNENLIAPTITYSLITSALEIVIFWGFAGNAPCWYM